MLKWIFEAVKAAIFDEVKDMATDKIKDEVKEVLDKVGVKLDEISDEAAEKVAEWKAGLDTETRRKVRKVWACIAALTFVLGIGVGVLIL